MVLITGGARVGKTKLAINLCKQKGNKVLYVATSIPTDDFFDKEMIRRSRKQRPFNWDINESYLGLASLLEESGGKYDAILIENVTSLVENLIVYFGCAKPEADFRRLTTDITDELAKITYIAKRISALVIFVTNEVNIHPRSSDESYKSLMEILGRVNQQLASLCNEVYFVVSSIPIKVK